MFFQKDAQELFCPFFAACLQRAVSPNIADTLKNPPMSHPRSLKDETARGL